MNQLTIIGNIGQDAKILDHNGRKAIQFHVAINKSYKNTDGVKVDSTLWISCSFWKNDKQGVGVAEYLKAGTQVMVQGEPSARPYQSKDGKWNASLNLNVTNLDLLGSKKTETSQVANTQASPAPAAHSPQPDIMPNVNFTNGSDDDLPF